MLVRRFATFRRLRRSMIAPMQLRTFSSKDTTKPPNTNCKTEGDKAANTNTKKEDPCAAHSAKNLTNLSGGSNMKPKKVNFCPSKKNKKMSCEELILQRDGKVEKGDGKLTSISGGGPTCPCFPKPKILAQGEHSENWKRYSLYGALPIVIVLSLIVLASHKEVERLEFKLWPNMYKRDKPFFFYDGNRTLFHNKHINALPPVGYEDEIDEAAIGKEPETEAQRKARLKHFAEVQKKWKSKNQKGSSTDYKKIGLIAGIIALILSGITYYKIPSY